jgi:DNA replication protein DnaC
MITNFNFPTRFMDAKLTGLDFDENTNKTISEWIFKPKNFFVFLSNPGIGKTHACYAMANYLREKNKYFRFMNERDFFGHLKEIMARGWETTTEIARLCETEFFFFNDLGSGRPEEITPWQQEQIFNLIDQRYEWCLPTIITSNHYFSSLKNLYEPRIISRLKARENTIVEINAADRRQQD